jgi:hypothetical protein
MADRRCRAVVSPPPQARIGVLAAPSGSPDEGQVVALQIRRPAGDGPAGQDLLQALGRHRGGPRHGQRGHSQGVGQIHAMHPRLHQARGHKLIQPHRPKEAGPMVSGGVVLIASRAWVNVSLTLSRMVAGVCP